MVQKLRHGFAALYSFRRRIRQLLQILQTPLRFRCILLLQHLAIPGAFFNQLDRLVQRQISRRLPQIFNQITKRHHGGMRARAELVLFNHLRQRIVHAQAMRLRKRIQLIHRGFTDTARRRIDHTQHSNRIRRRHRHFQVTENVFHLSPLVVTEPAHHQIFPPIPP